MLQTYGKTGRTNVFKDAKLNAGNEGFSCVYKGSDPKINGRTFIYKYNLGLGLVEIPCRLWTVTFKKFRPSSDRHTVFTLAPAASEITGQTLFIVALLPTPLLIVQSRIEKELIKY